MRTAKDNRDVPKRYYQPECRQCPKCKQVLQRAYPVWHKHMIFLDGRVQVISVGYRCPNPNCVESGRIYLSQAASRLTVRGSSFALDVIVQIGYLRFWNRSTVAQIHQVLTKERGLPISERDVLYLIGVFLVLLRCTYDLRLQEHAADFHRHGLFLAVDALKPEKGNHALYVVRELKFGLILHVVSLLSTDHKTLAQRLLQPVKDLGYRLRGIVSDDEKALVIAVARIFPGVPHQTCQIHCLRDAATPIANADRAYKKALKKAIRRPFYAVCRRINEQLAHHDPRAEVLSTYADLIRSTLIEGSKPPFALGGLRVFEDLARLEASLKRSRQKGGTHSWINFWPWSHCVTRSPHATDSSNANGASWWNWSVVSTHRNERANRARPASRLKARSQSFWPNWSSTRKTVRQTPAWSHTSARASANALARLFKCYAWPERYRTNNDLETFFGRLRTRQRQVHGRKSIHEFVIRYGEWAVFIDPTESYEQVLQRCQRFDQAQFDQEHARFQKAQQRLHVLYRFRHRPGCCLKELEQQWAEAIRPQSH